jgi:regulator of RNase E activity RraA
MVTTPFVVRGGSGVLVDGCMRDIPDVAAMTIGVYVRCGHASSVRPIMMGVDFQVPVRIVTVVPGETLMGEEHGVLVIPASIVDKVLEKAYSTTAERTSSVIFF